MKYKHIQAAHEVRMWVSTVIIPAVVGRVTLASNPNVQNWFKCQKYKVQSKFSK